MKTPRARAWTSRPFPARPSAALWVLAWRNVWRHGRRSALTIASIAFGLAGVMVAQSVMKTIQAQMVEKSTGAMSGHLQIQAAAVRDRKVPEKTLDRPAALEAALRADARVKALGARLLFTGLVYSAAASRGTLVVGVEPDNEVRLSIMPGYLAEGSYFGLPVDPCRAPGGRCAGGPPEHRSRGIVLGEKLARELDVRLGEKLVVMGQSRATGEMNSELFRVAGIHRSGSESFDGQIVYVPLEGAQRIRGEEGRVSYLVARLKDFNEAGALQASYAARAREAGGVALTYRQVGLEILGIQKFEDAVLAVVLAIIFSIVGLGVLNTVSMSLFERMRELGVMRALGCRPAALLGLLLMEGACLGALGAGAGLAFGWAVIAHFGRAGLPLPVGDALAYFLPFESILYLRPAWPSHAWSVASLGGVTLLAALGPAVRASRLKIVEALRHV